MDTCEKNLCDRLYHFIPYEQARVLFLGTDGKIVSSLLYGVPQNNWKAFMDFYSDDCIGSTYSLKHPLHLSENEKINICDWTDQKRKDAHKVFESYYVRPLKLKYCLGIGFSDQDNCIRCIISLDRTSDRPFTQEDILLVRKLRPLLDNYFIHMMCNPALEIRQQDFVLSQTNLTRREREIAQLLYRGSTPADVSSIVLTLIAIARRTAPYLNSHVHFLTSSASFSARSNRWLRIFA